jgi:putative membrane protein
MNTLAFHGGGPGPWILFVPLLWAAVVIGVGTVVRRTVWRGRAIGRRGPWQQGAAGTDEHSPMAVLGRRFAAGDIDEEEYWRRMSVLDEHFGAAGGTKD